MVGIKTQHATDGIRAIEQSCRTFNDLGAINRKLVYFQSVVIAPLLSFMFDTVLTDNHTVEPQTSDGGF